MSITTEMIGFIDSGIGGTTVMRELLRAVPDTPIVYRCDSRRWGDLDSHQVNAKVQLLGRELVNRGAGRILLACNSACATSPDLEEVLKVPVSRVLDAGLAALAQTGATKAIALVTPLTHRLSVVPPTLFHHNGTLEISTIPCPGLADAIEAGSLQLVNRILDSLPIPAEAEVALLGCTHYPLIEKQIGETYPWLDLVQPRATHLLTQLMR